MGDPKGPQSLKDYVVLGLVTVGCIVTAIVAMPFIALAWLLDKTGLFDE